MVAHQDYVSPEGLRRDGRRPREIRKIECRLGQIRHADGSVLYEQGITKILVVVHGPREARFRGRTLHDRAIIDCQFRVAPFASSERKKFTKGARRHREIAHLIKETFESVVLTHLYPRSEIIISVHVLQSDGELRAASINATSLALMSAGVPMRCLLVACSAGYLDSTPVVDLTHLESNAEGSRVMIAMDAKTTEIHSMQLSKRLQTKQLEPVLACATEGCQCVADVLRTAAREHAFTLKIV